MTESIIKNGQVILDLHPGSIIEINAEFILGHNLRRGSNAETYLKMHDNSKLVVNGGFKAFFNSSIEVFSGGSLTLGGGYLNADTVIACASRITIGKGAAIARGVYVYDSDHHRLLDGTGVQTNIPKPISIGDKVWIGVGAMVLKGVTIGDGAVIAAGAVVTRDVPPRCMAAGNPARVIRENVDWK